MEILPGREGLAVQGPEEEKDHRLDVGLEGIHAGDHLLPREIPRGNLRAGYQRGAEGKDPRDKERRQIQALHLRGQGSKRAGGI